MVMKRYERTRVLVEGDPSLLHEVVLDVERVAAGVVVLDQPAEELVMVQARETARGGLFYLGEALATSCRVSVEEDTGYGFVLGSDRCRAYELAVVDAAFSGTKGQEFQARWDERLAGEAQAIHARARKEAARVAATRVDFSTMKVEL